MKLEEWAGVGEGRNKIIFLRKHEIVALLDHVGSLCPGSGTGVLGGAHLRVGRTRRSWGGGGNYEFGGKPQTAPKGRLVHGIVAANSRRGQEKEED